MPLKEIPAISVVIPMYNVEKYIGDCLDSLLNQTFQDFEVIVVDDCSTDLSVAVVESYAEKFGGRLKLTKTLKNMGGGGLPRNKGMELSRGEYFFFLDADDLITPTALAELYELAEHYQADVIHSEKFIATDEYGKNLKLMNYLTDENICKNAPCALKNDFEERIKFFVQRKLMWNVVLQLIRRDFVMENRIRFCDIYAEDMLFTICEVCCAKKYIVVPNVIYFYRIRHGSSTTSQINAQEIIHRQSKALVCGIKYLDKFLGNRDFFSTRPDLKYLLFNMFAGELISQFYKIYAQIPASDLDELFRKELGGENIALSSFCLNSMILQRFQLMQTQYQFNQLAAQIRQQ